jgi:hypothetical protein
VHGIVWSAAWPFAAEAQQFRLCGRSDLGSVIFSSLEPTAAGEGNHRGVVRAALERRNHDANTVALTYLGGGAP